MLIKLMMMIYWFNFDERDKLARVKDYPRPLALLPRSLPLPMLHALNMIYEFWVQFYYQLVQNQQEVSRC